MKYSNALAAAAVSIGLAFGPAQAQQKTPSPCYSDNPYTLLNHLIQNNVIKNPEGMSRDPDGLIYLNIAAPLDIINRAIADPKSLKVSSSDGKEPWYVTLDEALRNRKPDEYTVRVNLNSPFSPSMNFRPGGIDQVIDPNGQELPSAPNKKTCLDSSKRFSPP